jgi:hypothetical protein
MNNTSIESPAVAESILVKYERGEFDTLLPDNDKSQYLIFNFPTVYVVSAESPNNKGDKSAFIAYVGETNNIRNRTSQHLKADAKTRDDWGELRRLSDTDPSIVHQYVIGHSHFNKSLTLDLENRMMQFLLGVDSIKSLNNLRTNPQGDYYTRDELEGIFTKAWRKLHKLNPKLFPAERVVRDSALFKASPFHELTDEQHQAERRILDAASEAIETGGEIDTEFGRLVLVQGAAGTGKTVLISHLFNTLMTDAMDEEEPLEQESAMEAPLPRAVILINHDEQKRVYNEIAKKLGLQQKDDEIVLKPSQFIYRRSERKTLPSGKQVPDTSRPLEKIDIALVDEAHLLLTQGAQSYSGSNMLLDVMRRARVTVAVFDPSQILESRQQWSKHDLHLLTGAASQGRSVRFSRITLDEGATIERASITLTQQFRIAANTDTVKWIDSFIDGEGIGMIPDSPGYYRNGSYIPEPYEIKVFDSPVDLYLAIREKSVDDEAHGLSRLLATYDWEYKSGKANSHSMDGKWNVELHKTEAGTWVMGLAADDKAGFIKDGDSLGSKRFCHPWNYQLEPSKKTKGIEGSSWAERPETIDEIGSTYTIQGFDLNYAGVIIGPSVKMRNGKLLFDSSASKSARATNRRGGKVDYSNHNLHNELNVLLKRGVHGLYLFAVDPELQVALKQATQLSH